MFSMETVVRNSTPRSLKNRETNVLGSTDRAEGFNTQNLITLTVPGPIPYFLVTNYLKLHEG